jgi:glutamate synthase domain-containing protein 2
LVSPLYIRISLNFEILGLNKNFTSKYFPYTPSRIEGIGLIEVEKKLKKDIRKHFQTRVSPAFYL